MSDQIVNAVFEPSFIIALLVAVAVFATIFTLVPVFGGDDLKARMKADRPKFVKEACRLGAHFRRNVRHSRQAVGKSVKV